jgi:hypothetical protein
MSRLKHAYPLIIFITSTIFSFCRSKTDASQPDFCAAKFISELNPTDTFLFDLPKNDTSILRLKRKNDRLLNLPSIENGFDSIQIKIYFGCALGVDFLVTLSNSNRKWTAELSKPEYDNSSGGEIRRASRKIIYADPKSGWKSLIRELFELKILTLPDDDDIPNLEKQYPSDGCGVAVEIATKKVYRIYNYENPYMYIKEHLEPQKIMRIIGLLANEFDLEKRFGIEHRFMWPH